MRKLLGDAALRAISYLEGLDTRSVAPLTDAVMHLAALDEPFPESPHQPADTLKLLDSIGSPATMATAGSRFFGFVIGGSHPVSLAANWLAGTWDQNAAYYNISPAAARFEQTALRWLLELFGLPLSCGAAFVTGATMANFSALAAARRTVLRRMGWDVEADGLFGAPPVTVIVDG